MVAVVTPAATLTTTASGSSPAATSPSRSGIMAGLTAASTIRAPLTAATFALGSASVEKLATPSVRRAAALASVRFVTRMPPSTVTPGASSPLRMAPPIEPAPRIATAGRLTMPPS